MAEFVSDCPRCGAIRSTHDVFASVIVGVQFSWQRLSEISCFCRNCSRLSIHLVSQKTSDSSRRIFGEIGSINTLSGLPDSLNPIVNFERHITLRDRRGTEPPEYLPETVRDVIIEANISLSNECWNAAGAMYRLALDLSTKNLLPLKDEPNQKIRRSLGLRLEWLFQNNVLSSDLKELAECVQQDGNDGSHDGSLQKPDAEDLKDFCYELVRRVYSEPKRLELAKERREERRRK